jgi:hypothetical protein
MKILFVLAVLGVAVGIGCSGSTLGNGGSGGNSGTGGAGCEARAYLSPGCDTPPTCVNGSGGACFSLACGCSGQILTGCEYEFSHPYAYTLPSTSYDPAVTTCDPSADAGH